MKRRKFISLTTAALSILAKAKITYGKKTKPNILFIMTDQQHANMMSCAGNKWLKTPNLDKLAKEGIRFKRAYAANPVCVPSRISMATGMMPNNLGAQHNKIGMKIKRLPEEVDNNSMGKIMKRAGYDTFYGGKIHMCKPLNPIRAGYDVVEKDKRGGLPGLCVDFIKTKRDKPFFAVASFINPHDICFAHNARMKKKGKSLKNVNQLYAEALRLPIDKLPPLPENYNIQENEPDQIGPKSGLKSKAVTPSIVMRHEYSDKDWRIVRWIYNRLTEVVDKEIGGILDGLKKAGLDHNTLIIFTSDHGNMAGNHKLASKGKFYEESVNVPFIMKYKKAIPKGRFNKEHLVSTGLDILPTMCDYIGVDIPKHLLGKSLRPIAEGKSVKEWRTYVASENKNRMICGKKFKYCIYTSGVIRESLVDLENDPGEMKNLVKDSKYKDILIKYRQYFKEWAKLSKDKDASKFIIIDG